MVIAVGTVRLKSNGEAFEKTAHSWKKSNFTFPEATAVIKLYKAHKKMNLLIDAKNSQFLKGQIYKGQPQGGRVMFLPDGQKLDKGFSLFGKHVRLHDQDSHDHWDVLYQNKGGTWSYCYSVEKKKSHRAKKYKKVHQFDKVYTTLLHNVSRGLKYEDDHLAVPMFTLLKTHMRIGNEIYFKAHNHKGLTTLKKKDISIKGNNVTFKYLAKDGVPRTIVEKFPSSYVTRLGKRLKGLKKDDFVFASCKTGHPLKEMQFKKAFVKYCGKEFYPHIVRSHYATSKVQSFLKGRRKASKEEVQQLYYSIASKLGHKKFVKKTHTWEDNYSVTVNHYIQPELVEKVKEITK